MTWYDWIIVVIPLLTVLIIGLKSQRYVKSVADFLAAGRVAGRYVICVASGEAAMGLVSLVAIWEKYYMVGFAIGFWSTIGAPLSLLMGLTGYCTYRYRETRAMMRDHLSRKKSGWLTLAKIEIQSEKPQG